VEPRDKHLSRSLGIAGFDGGDCLCHAVEPRCHGSECVERNPPFGSSHTHCPRLLPFSLLQRCNAAIFVPVVGVVQQTCQPQAHHARHHERAEGRLCHRDLSIFARDARICGFDQTERGVLHPRLRDVAGDQHKRRKVLQRTPVPEPLSVHKPHRAAQELARFARLEHRIGVPLGLRDDLGVGIQFGAPEAHRLFDHVIRRELALTRPLQVVDCVRDALLVDRHLDGDCSDHLIRRGERPQRVLSGVRVLLPLDRNLRQVVVGGQLELARLPFREAFPPHRLCVTRRLSQCR